eukprot:m.42049 g.42049  ORF g.42049 m.42049 type:complete len:271 (+) comp9837_c0_seq1:166-978(+)
MTTTTARLTLSFILFQVVIKSSTACDVVSDSSHDFHWIYGKPESCKEASPDQWGTAYESCSPTLEGNQSPIDLYCTGYAPTGSYVNTSFGTAEITLLNTGHNVQGLPDVEFTTTVDGFAGLETYKLAQFHMHWQSITGHSSSEHAIEGNYHPMELHMVHYNTKFNSVAEAVEDASPEALMVLGVMFQIGDESNVDIGLMFEAMQKSVPKGENIVTGEIANITMDVCKFLPQESCGNMTNFFSYQGGLTTPPCSPKNTSLVRWILFSEMQT